MEGADIKSVVLRVPLRVFRCGEGVAMECGVLDNVSE